MSPPNHVPFASRRAVSKRWHEAKAKKRMARESDLDTLRWRALDDARGLILRQGCTMRVSGMTCWLLRRSLHGRANQVDLLVNDLLFRTGSLRSALSAIRWQKWPVRQTA